MTPGYKVKQDRVHQAVLKLMKEPISAKQLAKIRGTNNASANNLLKVMYGKKLVRRLEKVKVGNHHTALWVAVDKNIVNITPKSVFEFNILAMAT